MALSATVPAQYSKLFPADLWSRVRSGTDSTGKVAPAVWGGLNVDQQQAIKELRKQDRFQDGNGGAAGPDLNGSNGQGRVVGQDPLDGDGDGLDVSAVKLESRPEKALFNETQWQKILQGPVSPWGDQDWEPLSPAQRRAVFDLKDEAFRQLGVRQIEDVIAEAKAAPANASVVEPWVRANSDIYIDQHVSGENDFNPKKNAGHRDEEFMAAAGYTGYVRDQHLHNHGTLMRSVADGADTISVTEFEDLDTLKRLVDQELPGKGYTPYLLEGTDPRGINVGLVTKHPLWPGTEHKLIMAEGIANQRGILKVELNVRGKHVVRYVFHAKSMRDGEGVSLEQNAKIFAAWQRDREETQRRYPDAIIMGMGDSNMKYAPQNHVDTLAKAGVVRDPSKCEGSSAWDATCTIPQRREQGVNHPLLPIGTHIFRGAGDYLDRTIINAKALACMVANSLVALPHINRFFSKNNKAIREGDSDHASMVVQYSIAA